MARDIVTWGGANKTNPSSADYPQGSAKNVSAPGAGDGTPWVADFVNQVEAFFQRLMSESNSTYNGDVDTATASQFYDAAASLFVQSGGWQLLQQVTATGGNSFTFANLPDTATAVMLRYHAVNFGTADRPVLRVNNNGTPLTSGYRQTQMNWVSAAALSVSSQDIELVRDVNVPGTSTIAGTLMMFKVGNTNRWQFFNDGLLSPTNNTSWNHGMGTTPSVSNFDGVTVLSNGGNNFTGGTLAVYYM